MENWELENLLLFNDYCWWTNTVFCYWYIIPNHCVTLFPILKWWLVFYYLISDLFSEWLLLNDMTINYIIGTQWCALLVKCVHTRAHWPQQQLPTSWRKVFWRMTSIVGIPAQRAYFIVLLTTHVWGVLVTYSSGDDWHSDPLLVMTTPTANGEFPLPSPLALQRSSGCARPPSTARYATLWPQLKVCYSTGHC